MHPIQFISNDILLPVLNFFYKLTGNYGWAIVLLTVAVRVILAPLTHQSTVQMKAMQMVQPKMKKIQEKYKDDPKELQKETLELYRREKVNPFGGCLPMLIQLPILIALFITFTSKPFLDLVTSPNVQASFFWILNLAKPDPTPVMIVLIGLSTFYSQKMITTDPKQAHMNIFMSIFIAVISVSFPAGVQIYWVLSTFLTMLQQYLILNPVNFVKK
jgi:YidC/Oxa1 family membrane protein insertase